MSVSIPTEKMYETLYRHNVQSQKMMKTDNTLYNNVYLITHYMLNVKSVLNKIRFYTDNKQIVVKMFPTLNLRNPYC